MDPPEPQQQPGQVQAKIQQLTNQQAMQLRIEQLEAENKRLRTRLADIEPHKQKNLRMPSEKKIVELFSKFEEKKYAFKVCYLGFCYDGMAYQKMNDENTVQAFLFKAFYTMSLTRKLLPEEDYTRAGRTDKGVSAMGNVIALKIRSNTPKNPEQLAKHNPHKRIEYCSMLNAILPEDIRILACQEVPDDFNARYMCMKRSYKYFFAKNNLNIQVMKEAIKDFVGTHNFINYCKMNLTNTVNFERTIFAAEIVKSQINQIFQSDANEVYYFHFVANSFLWHQIRFMTSVLFLVGSGQEKPNLVSELLDLKKFPKKPNYPMAPEYPLILQDCQYPNICLQPDIKTTLEFYKTFNELVMRKSTEKTLIINCMMMAQRDLISCGKITHEVFLQQYRKANTRTVNKGGKTLSMHKSSGRSFEEARDSLKGKRLELFQKKMEKQMEFEKKQKQGQRRQDQQQEGAQIQKLQQIEDRADIHEQQFQ